MPFFGKCPLPTFSYWADVLSAQTQFSTTRGWQDIIWSGLRSLPHRAALALLQQLHPLPRIRPSRVPWQPASFTRWLPAKTKSLVILSCWLPLGQTKLFLRPFSNRGPWKKQKGVSAGTPWPWLRCLKLYISAAARIIYRRSLRLYDRYGSICPSLPFSAFSMTYYQSKIDLLWHLLSSMTRIINTSYSRWLLHFWSRAAVRDDRHLPIRKGT